MRIAWYPVLTKNGVGVAVAMRCLGPLTYAKGAHYFGQTGV